MNDPVDGEDQKADFVMDWRHTRPPYVANDHIQFHLMGEMKYDDGQADTCNQDPEYATYMAQEDKSFSQMVVTEAAAKCALTAISRSPIGWLTINEERLNKMFSMFP